MTLDNVKLTCLGGRHSDNDHQIYENCEKGVTLKNSQNYDGEFHIILYVM